jgi:hypothetical protein
MCNSGQEKTPDDIGSLFKNSFAKYCPKLFEVNMKRRN